MKFAKYLVYALIAVFLMQIATAANTGYVINYPDGTSAQGCVYVADGSSAYNAIFSAYGLNDAWTANVLTKLGNYAADATNKWYLWSDDGTGMFSFKNQSYTTTKVYKNYVIGLIYGTNPATMPSLVSYSTLCPTQLDITSFKAKVDGSSISGVSENGGTIKVKPGSNVTLTIKYKNLWDDNTMVDGIDGIEITDITTTAIVEGIDDGDDLEADEEADTLDLGPKESGTAEMTFVIPYAVEDGSYSMPVTITSADSIDRQYNYDINLTVRVSKESHQVRFTSTSIAKTDVSCLRSNSVSYDIQNIGKRDEDVTMTLSIPQLSVSKTSTFELIKDPFDSDSSKSDTVNFLVPDTAAAGSYVVELKATYNDGSNSETKQFTMNVQNCQQTTPTTTTTTTTKNTTTTTTAGTSNPTVQIVRPIATAQNAQVQQQTEQSFWQQNGLIIGIVVAEIVVIGGALGLIFALRRRRY